MLEMEVVNGFATIAYMLHPEMAAKLRRKDGFPWTAVPWIGYNTITAIGSYVYVPPQLYDELLSSSPASTHYMAILKHEFVHINRQKDAGLFKWIALYLLSHKFRIEEELIADQARLEHLAQNGETFDIEQRARQLSSWLYLHGISYEDAKEALTRLWEEKKLLSTKEKKLE